MACHGFLKYGLSSALSCTVDDRAVYPTHSIQLANTEKNVGLYLNIEAHLVLCVLYHFSLDLFTWFWACFELTRRILTAQHWTHFLMPFKPCDNMTFQLCWSHLYFSRRWVSRIAHDVRILPTNTTYCVNRTQNQLQTGINRRPYLTLLRLILCLELQCLDLDTGHRYRLGYKQEIQFKKPTIIQ